MGELQWNAEQLGKMRECYSNPKQYAAIEVASHEQTVSLKAVEPFITFCQREVDWSAKEVTQNLRLTEYWHKITTRSCSSQHSHNENEYLSRGEKLFKAIMAPGTHFGEQTDEKVDNDRSLVAPSTHSATVTS